MSLHHLKKLDAGHLKMIAYISMVCDHANKAILLPYLEEHGAYTWTWIRISTFLSIIGTLAFPIFCFLIIESAFKTSNKRRFLTLLLITGILSEVPFDLGTYKVLYEPGHQNVLFTLTLTVLLVFINEAMRKHNRRVLWMISLLLSTFMAVVISEFLAMDFGFYGILLGMIFYLGHLFFKRKNTFFSKVIPKAFGYLLFLKEWYSFPSFLLLCLYNGKRGRQSKIINYLFYPVHFLILWLIYEVLF